MARKGLFLVYTGEGKGKTTASLGVTLRAVGRGLNVRYMQFIKSPERTYGEQIALRKLEWKWNKWALASLGPKHLRSIVQP